MIIIKTHRRVKQIKTTLNIKEIKSNEENRKENQSSTSIMTRRNMIYDSVKTIQHGGRFFPALCLLAFTDRNFMSAMGVSESFLSLFFFFSLDTEAANGLM